MMYFIVPGAFAASYVTWVMYLAVMTLERSRNANALPKPAYYLGLPLLYVGLVVDFLLNVTVASVLFIEIPHEWTVSARTKRHFFEPSGWRHAIAVWLAHNLLNPFDPAGAHVGMIDPKT
jgi:hypothetical protein